MLTEKRITVGLFFDTTLTSQIYLELDALADNEININYTTIRTSFVKIIDFKICKDEPGLCLATSSIV